MGSGYTMMKRTWLVTVAARGQEAVNGLDAQVLLRESSLGGLIQGHGFGPGAVDLEVKVAARTAAAACTTVRQRVADVLGPRWNIEVSADSTALSTATGE